MSADSTTPSYFAVPGWLAVRGGAGKEGPVQLFLSSPFAGGLAGRTAAAAGFLLGPAGDPKNALLRSSLGCYVADCA